MNPSLQLQPARGRKAKRARKKAKPGSGRGGVVRLVLQIGRRVTARVRRLYWKLLSALRAVEARVVRGAAGVIEVVLRAARRQARELRAHSAAQFNGAAFVAAGSV